MFTSAPEYAHALLPTPLKTWGNHCHQKHCCHRLVYWCRYPGKECWTAHSTVLSNHDRSFFCRQVHFLPTGPDLSRVSVRWSQVYQCREWHKPATWAPFVDKRLTLALILIYNRNINIFSLHLSRPPFCLCTSASTLSVAEVKTLTHSQIIAQ